MEYNLTTMAEALCYFLLVISAYTVVRHIIIKLFKAFEEDEKTEIK